MAGGDLQFDQEGNFAQGEVEEDDDALSEDEEVNEEKYLFGK